MNLSKYENAVFKYGSLDCCLWVCDVIRDHKGVDYAERWRGKYKGELGAFRLIRDAGGFDALMQQAFGEIKPIWSVKEFSPVLLNHNCVESDSIQAGLGIFDGNQIAALTDSGIIYYPVLAGRGCFHV